MAGVFSFGGEGQTDLEKGVVEGGSKDVSQDTALVQRELFWDKLTTFITSVLFGLATLNLFTQLLPRDSGIACDFSGQSEDNISEATVDFILGLCSRQLAPFNFLPVIIIVQGVLIAGPHFVWKSTFTSQFDYFFSTVSSLVLQRDTRSGHYPYENRVIIQQLEASFTTYNTSNILLWYRIKLFLQFGVALIIEIISISVPLSIISTDTFDCTLSGNAMLTIGTSTIKCILVTSRLFVLIWACDVTLIMLIVFLLCWGIIWSLFRHPSQLGHKDVATFSFNSGILGRYALPKPLFSSQGQAIDIKSRFFHPRIQNDLDFMLIFLFKANDGIGNVFKEGLVEIEMDRLYDIEVQLQDSFVRRQLDSLLINDDGDSDGLDKEDQDILSLGWNFPRENVLDEFKTIDEKTKIKIPGSIRGSVLGFSLRAPNNMRALEIGFGSLHGNYALALGRVFDKVGYINFDASYRPTWGEDKDEQNCPIEDKDSQSATLPSDLVEVNRVNSSFIMFRVADNILAKTEHTKELCLQLEQLYKRGSRVKPISLIVIGPIAKKEHLATVKLFLESECCPIEDKAVLVAIRPVEIEGKNTRKYFHKFIPPSSRGFKALNHSVQVVEDIVDWSDPSSQDTGQGSNLNYVPVTCGTSYSRMEMLTYRLESAQSSATP